MADPALALQTFDDVACTACGCVCDDLRLTVAGGRITRAEGACALAEPWLLSQESCQPPAAEIDGRACSLEDALQAAAKILSTARAPLIYGLSRSSTPGQRAAARLADRLGATIDTTASMCHAPSIMAVQEVGESTCTLGEISNRADLVVYWGSDPLTSHPRHMERYSTDRAGMFRPGGRADRTLVVADIRRSPTAEVADHYLPVEPGHDFEVLWALRALVADKPLRLGAVRGAPLAELLSLAEKMKSCKCGVVFFGLGLTQGPLGHRNVEALLLLVKELNAHTRFHARRMRVHGDVAGADTVLCWQTGFPFSVNLARGYPRYNPGEYSANDVLAAREADACLLVGSEGVAALSPAAIEQIEQIPTIALDYPTVESFPRPTVRITTAVYGVHLPGTAYRMDEVPIPLRAVLPPKYASDEEVLRQIMKRI
ncbi:MAG: formylmethanofuran dehydrogenase subunit B [Pirellulales bacterium]